MTGFFLQLIDLHIYNAGHSVSFFFTWGHFAYWTIIGWVADAVARYGAVI